MYSLSTEKPTIVDGTLPATVLSLLILVDSNTGILDF